MRRLLMISPHFPPDSSAGTHRVRLLAPHLQAYGWTPTVLTVDERDYEGRLDPALYALVPGSFAVERTRALSAGWTRSVGVGDLGVRALPGLRRAAFRLFERERFNAVFITIYPTYPAVLGPSLKRRFNVPFVLDYQDPWVGAWGRDVGGGPAGKVDVKSRLTRGIAERLEPRVLGVADGVTAVSARTFEEAIVRTGARPRATAEIPIGWDASDFDALANRPPAAVRHVPDDGRVNICYTGTLLPLGIDILKTVLGAARVVIEREPRLADRLRFYFFGTSNQSDGADERVMPYARDLGVASLVHEHPARLDYLDALAVLREASAILLMGSSEPHYTPSKVFPALLAGRPMLAVYHERSTVIELLRTAAPPPAAKVVTFRDPATLEAGKRCLADALIALATCADGHVRIDRRVIEPWSAHALAGRLAALCDRVCA